MEINQEKAIINGSNVISYQATNNNGHNHSQQQHQHQQTPGSTDALIINSNSNVVSEEIVLQLQEKFGDSKQIYILNTSSTSTTATAAGASGTNTASGSVNGSIQYLVVDKDVDINLLLQDPSIFQAAISSPPSQNACSTATNSNHFQNHHSAHNSSSLNTFASNNSKFAASTATGVRVSTHQQTQSGHQLAAQTQVNGLSLLI